MTTGMETPVACEAASQPTHRGNNFDLLRLVFALFVVVGHCFGAIFHRLGMAYVTWHGHLHGINIGMLAHIGLVGFFSISGYLVTASYRNSPTVASYLWKRVLRIWPAFLAAAAFSILVAGPLGSDDPRAYFRDLNVGAQLRAVALLHVCLTTAHTFRHYPSYALNGPTWSLPVEFAAYLFVAILGISTLLRRRWPVIVAWVGCTMLLATYVWFDRRIGDITLLDSTAINDVTPLYCMFLGGALVQLYPALKRTWVVGLLAVGWLVGHQFHVGYLCLGIAVPAAVVWVGEHKVRLPRPKDDLSYGIYLASWPVMQLITAYGHPDAPLLAAATIPISAALAFLSWRYIERPALALKGVDPAEWVKRQLSARAAAVAASANP